MSDDSQDDLSESGVFVIDNPFVSPTHLAPDCAPPPTLDPPSIDG